MKNSVVSMPGIGDKYRQLLSHADINYIEQLQQLEDEENQRQVSLITGIPNFQIKKWVKNAKLLQVHEINNSTLNLLNAAGIDSIEALQLAQPRRLSKKIFFLNEKLSIAEKVPMLRDVLDMVKSAKEISAKK